VTPGKNSCNFKGLQVVFVEEGAKQEARWIAQCSKQIGKMKSNPTARPFSVARRGPDDDEIEAAATSPFLYTRLRARIARGAAPARRSRWLVVFAFRSASRDSRDGSGRHPGCDTDGLVIGPSAPAAGYGLDDEA